MSGIYTVTAICAGLSVCYGAWLYAKPKIINMIINSVIKKYALASNDNKNLSAHIDTDDSGVNYITIPYMYLGEQYKVSLPYGNVMHLSQLRATAIKEDGSKYDITHQPGIPYIADPHSLGLQAIMVENINTGISISYDMAPGWCPQLSFEE